MFSLFQTLALYMPILIGIAWLLLMVYQKDDLARNTAIWMLMGITLMAVFVRSLTIVAHNLPMLIALLLVGYFNLVQFPHLTEPEQQQLSRANSLTAMMMIAYQAWYQYGNLWFPYLAQETLIMQILLPLYIIASIIFFCSALWLLIKDRLSTSN
ncbi:MAG: hypothetical protein AAFV93_04405 [Chloroflexota bacterium]